jgi:SPP1 family predicted phage head-tail adaptor
MHGGKLDRRIQFQRYTFADDGFTSTPTWANHGGKVWSSKTDVSDGEKLRADQVAANLTARFVVRHSSFTAGLTAKDRITYKGEVFEIYGIKEIGRSEGYEITAGAEVDD